MVLEALLFVLIPGDTSLDRHFLEIRAGIKNQRKQENFTEDGQPAHEKQGCPQVLVCFPGIVQKDVVLHCLDLAPEPMEELRRRSGLLVGLLSRIQLLNPRASRLYAHADGVHAAIGQRRQLSGGNCRWVGSSHPHRDANVGFVLPAELLNFVIRPQEEGIVGNTNVANGGEALLDHLQFAHHIGDGALADRRPLRKQAAESVVETIVALEGTAPRRQGEIALPHPLHQDRVGKRHDLAANQDGMVPPVVVRIGHAVQVTYQQAWRVGDCLSIVLLPGAGHRLIVFAAAYLLHETRPASLPLRRCRLYPHAPGILWVGVWDAFHPK